MKVELVIFTDFPMIFHSNKGCTDRLTHGWHVHDLLSCDESG